MMRSENIVTLPSGNLARGFNVRDLGNGRMQVSYVYTDRRRDHKVSRHFTAEFLNGRLESIIARSARGGRVETFKTSTILSVLIEMISEVNRANEAISNFRKEAKRVIETPVEVETDEQDDTDLMNTVRLVGIGVVINLMVTLATLGIVWYNL